MTPRIGAQSGVLRLAATGDIGSTPQAGTSLRAIGDRQPDLFLALGDLSYAGPGAEAAWSERVRGSLGDVPVLLLAGNHEEDTGEDGHIDRYIDLLPDPLGVHGTYGIEYWVDVDDLVRIVGISPNLTINDTHYYYGHDNDNIRWLADVIDDARARLIPWVIVCSHTNGLSLGPYYADIHQDLLTLLVDRRVDLVLHAHDHLYQRTKQLRASCDGCPEVTINEFNPACVAADGSSGAYPRGAGTVFLTSGAAGAELYPVDTDDPEVGYFATWMGANASPTYGFTEVVLTSDVMEVGFIATSDGGFTDRFAIRTAP